MKESTVVRAFALVAILLHGVIFSAVLSAAQAPPPVSVTTWHNDNWRTGQNTNETTLTTGANGKVNKPTFGLVCKISLSSTPQQEQAYAQPLVVANGDGSMTIYVATMQDYVYAFSVPKAAKWTSSSCLAVQNTVKKSLQLVNSGEYPADACLIGNGTVYDTCNDLQQPRAICPSAGALGTPVIDTVSNTLYVVTESQDQDTHPQGKNCVSKQGLEPNFYHRLHALDLATLAEKPLSPQLIPSQTVGLQTFSSRQEIQRPGLLFFNNTVYIAFSMMDGTFPRPSGWISVSTRRT
jgi:hypothetical protein